MDYYRKLKGYRAEAGAGGSIAFQYDDGYYGGECEIEFDIVELEEMIKQAKAFVEEYNAWLAEN